MRQTAILELLRQAPFHPFTMLEHPDQVMVSPLKIIFGVGRTAGHEVSRFEHLPLLHVTGLEEMQPN
jgi:hypothetical protein